MTFLASSRRTTNAVFFAMKITDKILSLSKIWGHLVDVRIVKIRHLNDRISYIDQNKKNTLWKKLVKELNSSKACKFVNMPIWKLTSLEVSKFAVTLKIRWFWIMSIWRSISLRLCQFARMSVQKLYHIESLSIWKSIRLKVCQLTRILVKSLLV